MGILEDAVITAKGAVDFAGKKTGEIVELSKLRISAAEIEGKIKNLYESLGRSVYNAAKTETDATALVNEKSAQIDTLTADLAAVQEKISVLREEKKCAACGAVNAQDANFCKKCGAQL
ncbi:MAG: zinc ribbon domain-containing protein [Ethanoligenens sp.]|uniref:zinc ribbon domain-containing protein n=1 Tax=Ethanoligenens sp. TaxID=2099655 RepID=UPI0039E952CD